MCVLGGGVQGGRCEYASGLRAAARLRFVLAAHRCRRIILIHAAFPLSPVQTPLYARGPPNRPRSAHRRSQMESGSLRIKTSGAGTAWYPQLCGVCDRLSPVLPYWR